MTPLLYNPDMPLDLFASDPAVQCTEDMLRVNILFKQGAIISYESFTADHPYTNISQRDFETITKFLNKPNPCYNWQRPKTPFENICLKNSPQKHLISTLHSLFYSGFDLKTDTANLKWEEELKISLSTDQWETIFHRLHKGSLNVLTQENGYKLYSRWYRTPHIVNKYNPNVSSLCWRCKSAPGTLLHIWWECNDIKPFWEKIHKLIYEITTYAPDYTAQQFLLHHSTLPNSVYKNSIILHLINAARLCIPAKWLQPSPPSVSDWLRRVQHIANMEDLIHQFYDSSEKFHSKWACWSHFTMSREFRILMDN